MSLVPPERVPSVRRGAVTVAVVRIRAVVRRRITLPLSRGGAEPDGTTGRLNARDRNLEQQLHLYHLLSVLRLAGFSHQPGMSSSGW